MLFASTDQGTLALAADFRVMETALEREIISTGPLTRAELVERVAAQLGRYPGDVRLALKRMDLIEDQETHALRLAD